MSAAPRTSGPVPAAETGRGVALAVRAALAVAGILLLLTSFAVWVNRVALDTDVFVDTSGALLEDDAIRRAIATRTVDELFDSVDVRAEIEAQLPEDLEPLSGPATAGLREVSYELVDRSLEQPALQRLWRLSLVQSHRTLVAVLEDDVGAISTEGGVVTLDLGRILLEAADRIGIRSQVEDKLPASAGRVEILRSDELDFAQDGARVLGTLAWVLPLLTLGAFALAVWLSVDRRRAVRSVGITVLGVGLFGLVAASLVGNYLVDSLASETDVRTAAGNAWDILTDLLRASFRWFVAAGILFVAAAWLAGPGRRAVAARRMLAPALRERVWGYGALGALVLALLLTGRVSDLVRILFLAALLALGAAWIELMRRQTLRELPDASGPALASEARERLRGWQETLRKAREERTRTRAPSPATDVTSLLAQLADLHARGELTDDEYASAKARVLSGE